jgi:VanZ family protein
VTHLLKIAFWSAATFAFVMAVLPHPPNLHIWDKWQHMAAFLTITTLGCIAYPSVSRVRMMLAMVAFGGMIEIVQMIPELHRDSQLSDWIADIVAVGLALAGVALAEGDRPARAE